jgi:hypothetical protein
LKSGAGTKGSESGWIFPNEAHYFVYLIYINKKIKMVKKIKQVLVGLLNILAWFFLSECHLWGGLTSPSSAESVTLFSHTNDLLHIYTKCHALRKSRMLLCDLRHLYPYSVWLLFSVVQHCFLTGFLSTCL